MTDETVKPPADSAAPRTHTVIGVLAGTGVALAIVGIAWWQSWYSFLISWGAAKVGAKIAVVTVAGCVAFTAWWRTRRRQRSAQQEEALAPAPEKEI